MMELYRTEKINPLGGCLPGSMIDPYQVLYDAVGVVGPGLCYLEVLDVCDESEITSRCCYALDTYYSCAVIGRPMMIDGKARAADAVSTSGWSCDLDLGALDLTDTLRAHAANAWIDTARGEHASVAAFARFNLHLMSLGAPADLLAASTRAMADEIEHARLCFGIASQLTGRPEGVGPMDMSGALEGAGDAAAILYAAVAEGCVGETIAAVQAAAARDGARVPAIRQALSTIADDESRHATLSWRFVRWMLTERPDLRPVAARAFADGIAEVLQSRTDEPWQLEAEPLGLLAPTSSDAVAARVVAEVIRPCAASLLDRPEVVAHA